MAQQPMLEGCETATLVSLEIDPFLKPWVQECLASMPNILSRHEIEVGPALDTLEKMPSSEAFDLVFIDANTSEYKRYVEVLIARGLLVENAMIVADNTLYCGIPFTPSEFVPFFVEVPPFKEVLMETTISTDVFFGNDTEACKLVSSGFCCCTLEPKKRSNTHKRQRPCSLLFFVMSFLPVPARPAPGSSPRPQTNGR